MLSGRLPYGMQAAKATTRAAQLKLTYQTVLDDELGIPIWIDSALRKAVHPNPLKRYDAISEFIHDMRHPNPDFMSTSYVPLLERNPLRFWKILSLVLLIMVVILLLTHPVFHQ
jgi:hypothetical protein